MKVIQYAKDIKKEVSLTGKYVISVNGKSGVVELELEDVKGLSEYIESLSSHIEDKSNPHEVTKYQVGLSNVDNTSDLDKPISIKQKERFDALELKLIANVAGYVFYEKESELKAARPTDKQAAIALDTKKTWYWNGSSWIDTGLSELEAMKEYVNSTPTFKNQHITDQHLDNLTIEGEYSVLFGNATKENGYPLQETCTVIVSTAGSSSKIQTLKYMPSGRVFMRTKGNTDWYEFDEFISKKSLEKEKDPKPLELTQNLNDLKKTDKYVCRYSNIATKENNYPISLAGILTVENKDGDSTVYQTYKTVRGNVYERSFLGGLWLNWDLLYKNLSDPFYSIFNSNSIGFNFTTLKDIVPSQLKTPIQFIVSEEGEAVLKPIYSNSNIQMFYNNGRGNIQGANPSVLSALISQDPIIQGINSTIAFSFTYNTEEALVGVLYQTEAGVNGRIQVAANAVFNGTALSYSKNKCQIFIHGVSDTGTPRGNLPSFNLELGKQYRVVLILAEGTKKSYLYVNEEIISNFTVSEVATLPTYVLGYLNGRSYGIGMEKIVSAKEVVTKSQLDEIALWLGKEKVVNNNSADILTKAIVRTSHSGAGALIPSNGLITTSDLLYLENETHVGVQASLTKVMTSIVLLDMESDLDTIIERTSADSASGSGANLNIGDKITIYSALRNLMLPSSNVTANIIARIYGTKLLESEGEGSITTAKAHLRWVKALNDKAKTIDLKSTIFDSPSGLDTDSNSPAKTTALDIVKMTGYASIYPALMEAWSVPTYDMPVTNSSNVQRTVKITTTVVPLLEGDYGVFGGKTGTLNRYGYNVCEIITLSDGKKIAIATLGASNDADRTADIRNVHTKVREFYNNKN